MYREILVIQMSGGINKNEERYMVIDKETGEILDDANGYGYKTKQTAFSGYSLKTKSKSIKVR